MTRAWQHGRHGGDYAAIVPLVGAGVDGSAPHLTWDDSPLRDNEGVFFEIAGCYHRYHCPLTRTVHFGEPPELFRRAEAAVQEGMALGLEKAKAGNTCEDVALTFLPNCAAMASRRTTAPAIPSACPARRTGASGR